MIRYLLDLLCRQSSWTRSCSKCGWTVQIKSPSPTMVATGAREFMRSAACKHVREAE